LELRYISITSSSHSKPKYQEGIARFTARAFYLAMVIG